MQGRGNDNNKNLFNHSDIQSSRSSITSRNSQAPNLNNDNQIPNFLPNLDEPRVDLQEVVNPPVEALSQNEERLQNDEIINFLFQEGQSQELLPRINNSPVFNLLDLSSEVNNPNHLNPVDVSLRINNSPIINPNDASRIVNESFNPNLDDASQIADNPENPILLDAVQTTRSHILGESHASVYASNRNLGIQIQNLVNDHQEVINQQNQVIRNNMEMAEQRIRENIDHLEEVIVNIQNNQPDHWYNNGWVISLGIASLGAIAIIGYS